MECLGFPCVIPFGLLAHIQKEGVPSFCCARGSGATGLSWRLQAKKESPYSAIDGRMQVDPLG